MRLLICAGGTGGGAYPALAALQALNAEHADIETLWVGSEAGMEAELGRRAGIRYATIPAAGLHGVGLAQLPRNLLQLGRGVGASARHLRQFRPDVMLFTGGYLAAPMAVAGRGVPTVLFVPDIEQGLEDGVHLLPQVAGGRQLGALERGLARGSALESQA